MAVEVTLEDAEWMVGRAGLSGVASMKRLPGGGTTRTSGWISWMAPASC